MTGGGVSTGLSPSRYLRWWLASLWGVTRFSSVPPINMGGIPVTKVLFFSLVCLLSVVGGASARTEKARGKHRNTQHMLVTISTTTTLPKLAQSLPESLPLTGDSSEVQRPCRSGMLWRTCEVVGGLAWEKLTGELVVIWCLTLCPPGAEDIPKTQAEARRREADRRR